MPTSERKSAPVAAGALGTTTDAHRQHDVTTAAPISNLAAALELARRGWPIHPLVPGSKRPMLSAWQHIAADGLAAANELWSSTPSAGIGIATGHRGVFVLDVDTKEGKEGASSLSALVAKFGPLPQTLTVRTATGGLHYYFASQEKIRNSAGKLGKGLDIRGAGGYVVAPPTAIDGKTYEWLDLSAVAPAPEWLATAAMSAAPTVERVASPATVEITPELIDDLRGALAALPADDRDAWIKAGAALRVLGETGRDLWNEWAATSDKHDPACDPQVFETIGHDSTGPAAIFAAAARLGWENPRARRVDLQSFGLQPLPAHIEGSITTLRSVDLTNILSAQIEPPRFVVAQLIPCGHVTLLGSHGGSGKSILALTIGAYVAAGLPWAGFAVRQGPVLYVSLEDPAELARFRLRKIIEECVLDPVTVTTNLRILDGSAGLTALMSEHAGQGQRILLPTATLEELRSFVHDATLIIIDNASDAFDGSENERRQVRTFVRTLATLGQANQAGVLLLAHIDKNAARFGSAGNSYSGSTAWHNSTRSRLALVDKQGNKDLVQEKLNLGRTADPVRLVWSDHGVLIPLTADTPLSVGGDADAVLTAIAAAIRDGVNVPTSRRGPSTTQHLLESVPELPPHLRGARGRDAFWSAISVLQRAGRIVVETYWDKARHEKDRYIVQSQVSQVSLVNGDCEKPAKPETGIAGSQVSCNGVWGIDQRSETAAGADP